MAEAARFGEADALIAPRTGAAPLRVGFISPDLCDHPVGLLLLPLLRHLDHAQLAPVLYSTGGRDDATRASLPHPHLQVPSPRV